MAAILLALELRADHDRPSDIVAENYVVDLFADWMAFDLVMPSTRQHSLKDKEAYWTSTGFGKEVHRMLRRRKLLAQELPLEEESVPGTHADHPDASPPVDAAESTKAASEGHEP